MQSMRCAACGLPFRPHRQVPQQKYCSSAGCQRERRRRWQAGRLGADPDYRANQQAAQKAWSQRHPEYWRAYRQAHPEYAERNRVLQRSRDRPRSRPADLAKMNASGPGSCLSSGTYRLAPVATGALAKMDAWTVQITVLSTA
jgi:hypothetical protein